MRFAIDRDFTVRTLADLVRINSINPSLEPGGPGEAEIAAYLARTLMRLGLTVNRHEPVPGRVSVVGRLAGAGPGPALMLNGHVDTVGVAGMQDPFSGAIRDGKLFARGAYDMKGSIAACLGAVKALADAGASFRGEVLLAAVADEEDASIGTADLLTKYRLDAAIVTEPTHLDICLAHKGFVWIEVESLGRAAHGSRFDLGVDANMAMGRFLGALDRLERELRTRTPHPLVGPPSLHAGVLRGGTAPSVYAASAKLTIERRTIPGETEAGAVAEIQAIVDDLAACDPSFRATSRSLLARQPFEVSPDARIVQMVRRAGERVLGRAPAFCGQTPWMDSALLAAAGFETVVIGPTGAGAHAAEEWVDLESVLQLAAILAEAVVDYLR